MTIRPRTRVAIVALIAAVAVLAARVEAPSPADHAHFSFALACAGNRWDIKTLRDRPRLVRMRPTAIAHLIGLRHPYRYPPRARLPIEGQVFSVVASVTFVQPETDLDEHLGLASGLSTMLAEAPSPVCTAGATRYRRRQMANSRKAARVCTTARVTGVAFFDHEKSRPTGSAPNGIELHPVLDFVCLAAVGPTAGRTPGTVQPPTRPSG